MIRAVIFDCFGVLTSDGWLAFKQKYFYDKPDLLEEAVAYNIRSDRGLIPVSEFIDWLIEASGASRQEVVYMMNHHVANQPLLDYIATTLHGRYKLGVLSNVGENILADFLTDEQIMLFDQTVFSFELGVTKPHPAMYRTIIDKLGVLPEEAVFIDDQPRFTVGARDCGLYSVDYQSAEQTIADIEALLRA